MCADAEADCRRPGRAGPRIGRQAGRGRLGGDHPPLAGGRLRAALCRAYEVGGFDRTAEGDVAFRVAGAGADHRAGQPAGSGGTGIVRVRTTIPEPARRPTRLPQADPPPEGCALRSESGLKCRGTQRGSLDCDLCAATTCPDTRGDGHPAGAGVPRASRDARRGVCGP